MDDSNCLLITLTDGYQLLRVAIKVQIDDDDIKYYLEPESKEKILKLLPSYYKDGFEIVEVKKIFEVINLK